MLSLLMLLAVPVASQQITEMQFKDKPITDILLVLAEISGQSIIADETVDGNATYFFSNTDLNSALSQFLPQYGIYYTVSNGIYRVSRILTSQNGDEMMCKAVDVDLQLVIRRLTREFDITILHDALPQERITINFHGGTLKDLLEILIKPYPRFYLEGGDHYYYLRKQESLTSSRHQGAGMQYFIRDGERYSADFQGVNFREALIDLMETGGKEFVFLGKNNDLIEYFRHSDYSFDEILDLLNEQGNSSYHLSGDIYYILEQDRQNILRQYFTTIRIPIENQAVDQLSNLFPSSLNYSKNMRIDKKSNAVILTGTLQEIKPLEDFVRQLEQKPENMIYRRYNLQYISFNEFKERLAPEMAGIPLVALGDKAFLTLLSENKHKDLESYLTLVDSSHPVYAVRLAHLRWAQLRENLPPAINEDQIHPSSDPTLVFFQGSKGEMELLQEQLKEIDKPIPQIRYEILVLQIEESQGLNLDSDFSVKKEGTQGSVGYSGTLSGLVSLSFDVVNQLGYQFAVNLSMSLSQKRSRVLADTTMYGLSGEQIRFQNTNTSRYPTTQIDADTGEKEVTGFREITSGLLIDVNGWVSGGNMITMDISTTISSETDSSKTDTDTIPTTTEKILNTHVRSPSGEPLVLSGLKQHDTVNDIRKIPGWGDIPLLGLLFQKRVETLKNTEFLITLIPYVMEDERTAKNPYTALYDRFCQRTP